MMKFKKSLKRYGAVPCATGLATVAMAFPSFATEAGAGSSSSSSVLTGVTSVLTWALTAMTSISTWLIGNPLGAIYIGMFIIGFAVALMFRVLHSA